MSVGSATSGVLVSTVAASAPVLSPLASALANAEEVYRSEPVKKYLARNFEVSTEPNSVNLEQLLEDLKTLFATSTGPKKENIKKRIIVILNLIYPSAPKKEDNKDINKQFTKALEAGSAQAGGNAQKSSKSYEVIKKDSLTDTVVGTSLAKMPLADQAFRPSDTGDSSAEMLHAALKSSSSHAAGLRPDVRKEAENFQRKASLLLLVYEFTHLMNNFLKVYEKYLRQEAEFAKSGLPFEEQTLHFPKLPTTTKGIAFILRWAKILKGELSSYSIKNVSALSFNDFMELESYCSDPNEEIRAIAKAFCEGIKLHKARQEYHAVCKNYLESLLKKILPITKIADHRWFLLCDVPFLLIAIEAAREIIKHADARQNLDDLIAIQSKCITRWEWEFHKLRNSYNEYFNELQEVGDKNFQSPSKKLEFQAFKKRLWPSLYGETSPALPAPDKLKGLSFEQDFVLSGITVKKTPPKLKKKRAKAEKKKQKISKAGGKDVRKETHSASLSLDKIFKGSLPEITYDLRVLAQMQDSGPNAWKHGFTQDVDHFVGTDYCIEGPWNNPTTRNKDRLICIPGEIQIEGEPPRQGVFHFCFDANNVCYHRYFGASSNVDLIDAIINPGRAKIEFPTLAESLADSKLGSKKTVVMKGENRPKIEIDRQFGTITILDRKNKMTIKLFKIGK